MGASRIIVGPINTELFPYLNARYERASPPEKGLGEPKRKFEETFSAETVVVDKFFKPGGR